MNFRTLLVTSSLVAAALLSAGTPQKKNLLETAGAAGSFKTLAAAVKAAGLEGALTGDKPLTVFAPTDAAFAKLEKAKPGTIEMLLKPENKDKLVAILTYHVVPGAVKAQNVLKLKNGTMVKTLNGQSLKVNNKHGVQVNHIKVVKTDIIASNGVIHVIDGVLLPK